MTALPDALVQSWPTYSNKRNNAFLNALQIGAETGIRYLAYVENQRHNETRFGVSETGKQRDFRKIFKERNLATSCDSVFFTPNQFVAKRSKNGLKMLCANWLDIDLCFQPGQQLTFQLESQIYDQILTAGEVANLPAPSFIVFSGSGGLHLYWVYKGVPVSEYSVADWQEVARKLISAFPRNNLWKVDYGASIACSGLMRLPGSINPKTGKKVEVEYGGPIYEFAQLRRAIGLSAKVNVVPLRDFKQLNSTKEKIHTLVSKKHRIGQWWLSCYLAVLKHFRELKAVPEGKRDKAAFILFVALRHLKSSEDALNDIKRLNRELIGLPQPQLMAYLASARINFYRYNKLSLSLYLEDLLGYVPEFLNRPDKPKLSKDEVKARQSKAASTTARAKSAKTLAKLHDAVLSCQRQGLKVTQSNVAQQAKVSIRTVKGRWHQLADSSETC